MQTFHSLIPAAMLAALAATPVSIAQVYEQVAPKTPPTSTATVTLPDAAGVTAQADAARLDEVLVPALRGLVFLGDRTRLQPNGVSVADVTVDNLPFIDRPDFIAAMRRYLGQPLTVRQINALTRDVVLYFRTRQRPIVDVFVPEQNVSSGTLQLLVIEGRLGRVDVEGNKHFAREALVGAIRSQRGEVIDGQPLLADIAWLNQNPFRQVDLVFTRGSGAGETDVLLRTEDRRPIRVYGGYEDTGNDLTGDERVQLGVNWGNAFGRDHLLNYQVSASPDLEKLVAHSGSYVVPLSRTRHMFTVFGSFAESRPELPGGVFSLEGRTWQVSARYRVPLRAWGGFEQEVTAGIDFKRSNNNLAFGGAQVFAQENDVVQAILSYGANRSGPRGALAVSATLAASPGRLTSGNHRSDYRAARSFARPDYLYGRFEVERRQNLARGLTWAARGTAQIASANLLGSEQLGLGGWSNLRGYEEREANGDNGFMLVNELRGRSRPLAHRLGFDGVGDRFEPLAFLDYGVVSNHERLPGEPRRLDLASAGVGFRYGIGSALTVRFDYGWQLKDSGVSDGRRNHRGHVGVVLAY